MYPPKVKGAIPKRDPYAIKQCPFCNGEGRLKKWTLFHMVICLECDSQGEKQNTEKKAIKAWNKRYKKRKPRKVKSDNTKRKDIANELWRRVVYKKDDEKCQLCGKTTDLNAHHLNLRPNYRLQFSLRNGICLCWHCHKQKAHSQDDEVRAKFKMWVTDIRGTDIWQTLDRMKHDNTKTSIHNTILFLTNELKKYE